MALFGCGDMGFRHLRSYAAMETQGGFTSHLVGIVDLDGELLARRAEWYRTSVGREIKAYESVEHALEDEAVDAVDIVAPSHVHHVLAIQALGAGRHVLIEKPLALTMKAGSLIVDAARDSGRVLAVAHNYRFFASNRALHRAIQSGEIGQPLMSIARYVAVAGGKVERSWIEGTPKVAAHDVRQTGSRAALAMGVHEADSLRYWFGEVAEVFGVIRTYDQTVLSDAGEAIPNDNDDTAMAFLLFESGMSAQFTISFAGRGCPVADRVIYGSRGSIRSSDWASWDGGEICTSAGRSSAGEYVTRFLETLSQAERRRLVPELARDGDYRISFADPMRYGIASEIEQFACAVVYGDPVEVDGEDALKSDAISFALLESAALGRPVKVAEVESGALANWQAGANARFGLAEAKPF